MLPPSRKRRSQNSTIVDNITSAQKQLQFQKSKRIKKSEFRPETTTKEQCKKDRSQEELANKFLMLCLASYGGSSVFYSVLKFISIGSLDQSLQLQEIQFPSSGDGDCFGMGFGVVGSNLYVLGGQRREKKGKHAASLPRYSLYDCNPKVFMLDLANSKTKVASQVGEMLSGMASPLIIVVEGKLYVLAGIPVSMLPKHPFEATWQFFNSIAVNEGESSQFSFLILLGNLMVIQCQSISHTIDTM
ncbi:hypothetical protein LOK49_LG09G02505 [Camellia lanceoleosa]|uniref:Uncharacterized protein n=1 Tax=Camellia lanceoleosa TaxID=1840588 RepID=A0ACC0GJ69_9ERIC|nr:hypothetical protein LOK49_LG09G02505 [Camellia lanceoleosa]